jgi:hypothetical protein
MNELKFMGDLSAVWGVLLALAGAVLAWWVYRREDIRRSYPTLSWVLPVLRAGAIFMLIFMLAGPVLHHREVIGELGRILVFLDTSKSMSIKDEHNGVDRKLLEAHYRGWLPPGTVDASLVEIADQIGDARRGATNVVKQPVVSSARTHDAAKEFSTRIAAALAKLRGATPRELPAAPPQLGSILREFWTNQPGGQVADFFTNHKELLDKPTGTALETKFEAPANWGDNYAQRMRGYVYPPATGNYTFWIASDDTSELWLSTDDSAAGKKLIAKGNVVPPGTWPEGDSKSQPVPLVAGKRYYIEALHKEGAAQDFLAVGWALPNGTQERPIPGARLAPASSGSAAPSGSFPDMVDRFEQDVAKPAAALASRNADDKTSADTGAQLLALADSAALAEVRLRQAFATYAQQMVASGDKAAEAAIEKYDHMTRWQRAQSLLLGKADGVMAKLAEKHDVELLGLMDDHTERLWVPVDDKKVPESLPIEAEATTSDLTDGIRQRLSVKGAAAKQPGGTAQAAGTDAKSADAEIAEPPQRTAVVIVSDGQHNEGASPIQLAKILGNRQIPVYTIGVGSLESPPDLAVLKVEAPEAVFHDDRAHGQIVVKDSLPAGKPFTLKIEQDGNVVWEKNFISENSAQRRIDFDFPIQPLIDAAQKGVSKDVQTHSLPLNLVVKAVPVPGEARDDNNEAPLAFRAITDEWKVLIIDDRPRWETRYLRNVFDRDRRWKINTILVGPGSEATAVHRAAPGTKETDGIFPTDRQSLFAYDLVVFGEVPVGALTEDELGWVRDFAQNRGGGVIFLDGPRQRLADLVNSPISALLPVKFTGSSAGEALPERLQLTDTGGHTPALMLASDSAENGELWRQLPPPHRASAVEAVPGTETLVEAVVGQKKVPMMVLRRFGAGRVLFMGSDESWRWRYEVADHYHQRFWNQLAEWIMEQPYAVSDKYASLDAGAVSYRPGDSANIRVRLRDAEGKPLLQATAEALLWRDGKIVSTVMLEADQNQGGAFHGKTAALADGKYQVTVRVTGMNDDDMKARTEFSVAPQDTGEMTQLAMNEDLLRQVADVSGGQYLREEYAGRLPAMLEPLSAGRVVESDTALSQSYFWFVPMIALLTAEWLLRKRSGML